MKCARVLHARLNDFPEAYAVARLRSVLLQGCRGGGLTMLWSSWGFLALGC